jgi:hypothetical protein
MATELADLVVAGINRATASLARDYGGSRIDTEARRFRHDPRWRSAYKGHMANHRGGIKPLQEPEIGEIGSVASPQKLAEATQTGICWDDGDQNCEELEKSIGAALNQRKKAAEAALR